MIKPKLLKNNIKDFISQVNEKSHIVSAWASYCKDIASKPQWIKRNPRKFRECLKRYSLSEKGIEASKRRTKNRNKRFKDACSGLSKDERIEINEFYNNCPDGYVVDHVISLYAGGLHRLDNLQYLTKEQNGKKATECYFVLTEC